MKYTSVNKLCDFEFHDALMKLELLSSDCLKVIVSYLNIHKDADENPYDVDMEIAKAIITFQGFELRSYEPGRAWQKDDDGNHFTDDPLIVYEGDDAYDHFREQLSAGITVFDLGTIKDCYYIDAMSKDPFFTIRFLFQDIVVEWDDYKQEAWYVKK